MKKTDANKVVKVRRETGSKATKIKSSIKAGAPFECEQPPPRLPVKG